MNTTARLPTRILAVFLVMAAVACARIPPPTPGQSGAGFPANPAIEVFAAGYGAISDKFVRPVAFSAMATEGLRGLQTVDPEITITAEQDRLILSYAGRTIATQPKPDDDNVEEWARATFNLISAARIVSLDLAAMGAEKLYESIFDAALTRLDRFSRYAGAAEAAKNRAARDGYSGIGVRFRMTDAGALITMTERESPASELGIKAGDVITRIDGHTIRELSSETVRQRLRGPENTTVMLVIARPGQKQKSAFSVQRTRIIAPTVTVRMDGTILIATISRFNQNTAASLGQLINVEYMRTRQPDGIILDLRGNPGGLLKQSIIVADMFVRNGRLISTEGRHPDSIQHYFADDSDISNGSPMIVLVDGRSASAAEILAATLEDRGRALVIGSSTYGKGTVQTVFPLPNNGEMTLTWSRFVVPSGFVPNGLGVIPTLCTSAAILAAEAAGQTPTAGLVLGRLSPGAIVANNQIWHATPVDDTVARAALRADCPPQLKRDNLSLAISKSLIKDIAAYHRFLAALNTTDDIAETNDDASLRAIRIGENPN